MPFKSKISWDKEVETLKEILSMGYTLQQIGDLYGVTRERTRQVLLQYKLENGVVTRRKKREASHYQRRGDEGQDDYQRKRIRFSGKKSNAKRTGREFTIQFGDLEWPSHCPILGIELDYYAGNAQENSPSIDQINSSKGYVPGNVAVISWRANRIKNNGTAEEHLAIYKWLQNKT